MHNIFSLGVCSNLGFLRGSSHQAPFRLSGRTANNLLAKQSNIKLQWQFIEPDTQLPPWAQSQRINQILCKKISQRVAGGKRFLVVGGDHSVAMGTWSGLIKGLSDLQSDKGAIGLLWIDAHMDAHNFSTSPSDNTHGMPIFALLSDKDLSLNCLCPAAGQLNADKLVVLGVRSYEESERNFLESRGVTIGYMNKLRNGRFHCAFIAALQALRKNCSTIGISIDMDAIDPLQAPGVASPVAGGINLKELCAALEQAKLLNEIIGLEICEYDPSRDIQYRTRSAVIELIKAFYGDLPLSG